MDQRKVLIQIADRLVSIANQDFNRKDSSNLVLVSNGNGQRSTSLTKANSCENS